MNKWPLIALAASAATTNVQALTVSFEPVFSGTGANVSPTASIDDNAAGFDDAFSTDFQLLGSNSSDAGVGSGPSSGSFFLVSTNTVSFTQGLIDQDRATLSYRRTFQEASGSPGSNSSGNDRLRLFLDPQTAGNPQLDFLDTNFTSDSTLDVSESVSIADAVAGDNYNLVLRLDESPASNSNVAAGFSDITLTAIPEPKTTLAAIVGPTLILGLWLMGRHRRQLGHVDTRG